MRQRIADKLHDSGGATILMALFAMLVASVVCIVILGASVTAVKQSVADHEQEQNTLTLQSAGELVRSEILSTGLITFTAPKDETNFVNATGSSAATTSLSSELIAVAKQTLNSAEGTEGTGSFSITATTNAGEPEAHYEHPPVQGDIVLKGAGDGYKLIVTMSVDSATGTTGPQYLILSMDCVRSSVPGVQGESGPSATFVFSSPSFSLVGEASTNG